MWESGVRRGSTCIPQWWTRSTAESGAETQLGWEAVRETSGQVLTFNGVPIDAFFYSTCGGQTAAGTEVFVGANRPYLQSVCRPGRERRGLLPLFSPLSLARGVDRRSAEDHLAGSPRAPRFAKCGRSRSCERPARTGWRGSPSESMMTKCAVDGPSGAAGAAPGEEPLLRSGAFTLTESREGRVVTGLVAEGRGSGHGVGFCQWGAVGRARAGPGISARSWPPTFPARRSSGCTELSPTPGDHE